jgi:uncharacterized membrane protein
MLLYLASHLLKAEGTRRFVLHQHRSSKRSLSVAFSLLAGSAIAMALAGSTTGVNTVFLDLLSIFSIILCPICVKGSGYRIAMVIGIIAILSAAVTFVSRPIEMTSLEGLTILAWAIIATAIIQFAYSAYRENSLYQGF